MSGLGIRLSGPVTIGNKVNLAQNVVISGLNHNFEDVNLAIADQGVSTQELSLKTMWIEPTVLYWQACTSEGMWLSSRKYCYERYSTV